MLESIRNFFFDLSKAPVNSQFNVDAKNIVFEVGGGGPFPSGGYIQVDSNSPTRIDGAFKLNIGFVKKVRWIHPALFTIGGNKNTQGANFATEEVSTPLSGIA
ncbi:MAG: hypothetical protein NUW37_06460, partial [Planctomycetes bacterium]|nr:hypothetical protein [Planctomycetota bacterium]